MTTTHLWRTRLVRLCLSGLTLVPAVAHAQTTAMFFDSQPGDYIGGGRKTSLNSVDANFSAARDDANKIHVSITGPGFSTFWYLDFRAPGQGPQPVPGTYTTARRASFTSGNGLDVAGDGRGCNNVTGRFVVLEAVYSGDQVFRFAADFEQHCEDMTPALFGAIRYNSTVTSLVPFGGHYPSIDLTITLPAHGRIQGATIDCGAGSTACSTIPAATGAYALTATADAGYLFAGWGLDCSGGPTTTVNVNSSKICSALFLPVVPDGPRTFAILNGAPGEYLSRGQTIYLSDVNSRWTLSNTFGMELKITADGPLSESYWRFDFAPPTGETFQPGREYVLSRFGEPGTAKLDIVSDGSGCNQSFGSLLVREWMPGTGSLPVRFVFDFEFRCDNSAPLTGTIQYQSGLALPLLQLDRGSLRFAVTTRGTTMVGHSPDQVVQITQAGAGATSWQLKSDQPWLTASPPSGSGPGTITIKIKDGATLPFGGGPLTGHIKILTRGAVGVPEPVSVTASLLDWASTAAPVGSIDTPLQGTTGVRGSIGVTGWAIDDVGVSALRLYRAPVSGETPNQLVFIGTPARVDGARPDIASAFPTLPLNTQAGWGYLLLTNMLPNGGDGAFTLYVYADDVEGHSTLLGVRTIVCANSTSTAPFGAIDTPDQGAVLSSITNNFGWVLSPGSRRADPPGGGTVTVFIDGAPAGAPSGWTSRSDLTALFPAAQYFGVGSALGVFTFDAALLPNGTHTIAWLVTDNQGGAAGVGSRYFTVFKGSALTSAAAVRMDARPYDHAASVPASIQGRRGFDRHSPVRTYSPDSDGVITVQAEELDLIELRLAARDGHLVTAQGPRPLPFGSSIDADGSFRWQPGVAFVGPYRFIFDTDAGSLAVTIVLNPKGSNRTGNQLVIDTPRGQTVVGDTVAISGWAADLGARHGSGIAVVHVWAYPVGGGAPVFCGSAAVDGVRPDVADVYGAQFAASGFTVTARGLLPGDYDLAVFAWSEAGGGFLPAKTVRVRVR